MNQEQLILELEKLVDASNLYEVTMALSLLCTEKVEHIETTWQDNATAAPWRAAEKTITRAARHIADLGI